VRDWTDLAIEPADRWDDEIALERNRSQIVLLLISADLLASKCIAIKELVTALQRARRARLP